jgi:hypothetical protein
MLQILCPVKGKVNQGTVHSRLQFWCLQLYGACPSQSFRHMIANVVPPIVDHQLQPLPISSTVDSRLTPAMTELGSFGPGWFYSVFGISVEFDNAAPLVVDDGEIFAVPWFSFNGQAYLYSGDDTVVRGTIKLNTYNNNREVWHGGVTVRLSASFSAQIVQVSIQEYIHTLDPYVSTEVKSFQTMIAKEDVVKYCSLAEPLLLILCPQRDCLISF